jgi:hypothetical protein
MKTILFVMTMALACSSVPSHADALPKEYIGKWCLRAEKVDSQYYSSDTSNCPNSVLTIDNKSYYTGEDYQCNIISIKTGKKEYYIPDIRIVARCHMESQTWIEKRELRPGIAHFKSFKF